MCIPLFELIGVFSSAGGVLIALYNVEYYHLIARYNIECYQVGLVQCNCNEMQWPTQCNATAANANGERRTCTLTRGLYNAIKCNELQCNCNKMQLPIYQLNAPALVMPMARGTPVLWPGGIVLSDLKPRQILRCGPRTMYGLKLLGENSGSFWSKVCIFIECKMDPKNYRADAWQSSQWPKPAGEPGLYIALCYSCCY